MMYPIKIKREPQKLSVDSKVDIGFDGTLSIQDLRNHGVTDGGYFEVIQDEGSHRLTLHVYNTRLETSEEVEARVAKEEAYMEMYYKEQEKKQAKKSL